MALALFDLDNTLIAGDSDHAWGEFLISRGMVEADSFKHQNDGFYEDYKRGELDIHAYLSFVLAPVAQIESATLQQMLREFLAEYIQPLRLGQAEALLQHHRELGDHLLIITATSHFITRPIADLLGVSDLLASDAEIIDGRMTGRPAGIPCYREGKVHRLQNWLDANGKTLSGSCFYSDSHNDLPLLEAVDTPVVVDADDTLLRVAKQRGWRSISLRN